MTTPDELTPAPLSAEAMRRAMMVGSGVLGVLAMPTAVLLSDSPAVAIITSALVMAVIWGALMWWALRSRTRVLWRQAAQVRVTSAARADGARRARVRGFVLSLVISVPMAAMVTFMTALTGQSGLWSFWPGFLLGACLWMALELRDLTRWQDEVGCEVLLRGDIPWLGGDARKGGVFVLADRANTAGTAS